MFNEDNIRSFEETIKELTTYREADGFYTLSKRLILKMPMEAEDNENFTLLEIAENGGTTAAITMTKEEAFNLFYMLRED